MTHIVVPNDALPLSSSNLRLDYQTLLKECVPVWARINDRNGENDEKDDETTFQW